MKRAAAKLIGKVINEETVKQNKENQADKKKKKNAQKLEVTFDVKEDLKNFKADNKKVISIGKDDQVLRDLFITPQDEEQAMEDFEREKDEQIEDVLGNKVKVPIVQRGWNEWAGNGVNEKSHENRLAKVNDMKKKKIDELKKQRADSKMKGVVLNMEDRDKKFAQKYLVK